MGQFTSVDLFVIGGGSGGVRAARIAAGLGASVVLAEAGPMGGTCVNVGCVPKKLMVYASAFSSTFDDAVGFGWSAQRPAFSLSALKRARDNEVTRLNGIYDRMLVNAGVKVVRGRAALVDGQNVTVNGEVYTARKILIATGGQSIRLAVPGGELIDTSDAFFEMETLPRSAAVIGGGYIALEFATILCGLGVAVTLIHRSGAILRGFDQEVRDFVGAQLSDSSVDLRLNTEVLMATAVGDEVSLTLSDGDSLLVDRVFSAVGRRPNTVGLNLETVGVAQSAGGQVIVNDQHQTSVPTVYAVGDVTDTIQLTPVALAQGMAFARNICGVGDGRVDLKGVPSVVFSQPAIGMLGLTEEEAVGQGRSCRIYCSTFRPMKATLSGRLEKSLMKLVVDDEDDKVIGIHLVAPDAAEMLQGFAVAMKCGATHSQLLSTIGIHPSSAEELVTMRTPTRTVSA